MEENISEPNLSDLIDVIMNDMKGDIVQGGSYVGGGDNTSTSTHPIIEIVEQPKLKVRFRYECEGRSAGSILGANSTNDTKSYPAIKIRNHKGSAIVVVSCVTKDEPYRPHPHKLVGKENCENGIYTIQFSNEGDTKLPFTNLGIQCMKKKDIDESLKKRQELNVDPFKTGFAHRTQISTINLNAVRLCFQAFLPLSDNKFEKLRPVVSDPIYDSKSNSDLVIHTLSHVSAPVAGGMKMILLCDKVTKEDIKIRFFEVQGDNVVWEGYGDFQPQDVHKQFAIVFKTPTYKNLQITEPVNIHIQLVNSKKSYSEPYNFKFTPLDSGRPIIWRYRKNKAQPEVLASIVRNSNTMIKLLSKPESEISSIDKNDYARVEKPSHDYAHVDKQPFKENNMNVIVEDMQLDNANDHIDQRFQDLLDEVTDINRHLQNENNMIDINQNIENGNFIVSDGTKSNECSNSLDVNDDIVMSMEEIDEFNNTLMQNNVNAVKDNMIDTNGNTIDNLIVTNGTSVIIEEFNDVDKPHLGLARTEGYGSYSSLQLAMKNQFFVDLNSGECYEDVLPPEDIPPVLQQVTIPPPEKVAIPPPRPPSHTKPDLSTLKKIPPKMENKFATLPTRKSTSEKFGKSTFFDTISSHTNDDSTPPLPPKRVRKSGLDKNLPPVPKYKSFFHKLFKTKSKSKPSTPRERSLSIDSRQVAGGGSINEDVMLTEAEHYALYTSIAPHATQSEFDEASFYYSPVEGVTAK